MPDIQYINTQEIRKDLHGFLKSVESGREVVVLNRSKAIARLNRKTDQAATAKAARKNMQEFLAVAAKARRQAKGTLDPNKSIKELYAETISEKYAKPPGSARR